MGEKQAASLNVKTNQVNEQARRKPKGEEFKKPPEHEAVDRPGFDLGGASGKTSAGTGLGLGENASENSGDRSLPGRRGKRQ